MEKYRLEIKPSFTIRATTGQGGRNELNRAATERFYWANKGDYIEISSRDYLFNVATYLPEIKEEYIASYSYANDEAWYTYQNDLNKDTYRHQRYVFSSDCYFRVCLKRVDDGKIELPKEELSCFIDFFSLGRRGTKETNIWHSEIEKMVKKFSACSGPGDLALLVLTDTHVTLNGTWQDTAANISLLCQKLPLKGIIHLGDLTDGLVSRELTREYAQDILSDLKKNDLPIYVALGNHDANYFGGNPDVLTIKEQAALYQDMSLKAEKEKNLPYYHVDLKQDKLRLIFLSAYENEAKDRYGFDLKQIEWLDSVLGEMPEDNVAVIFSHDAPLTCLDVWAAQIRNEKQIMAVLRKNQKKIFAFIHGHTHADYIYEKESFPIVSVGCAKCEAMQEHKPEGSVTPQRAIGTSKQELFDVVLIKAQEKKMAFLRFGAGEDRQVNRG